MFGWNRSGVIARHRVFARLLLPYLLFLILTLFAGWIIYNKTIDLIENEVTENQMNVLEQNKDILERRLDEVSSITQQLASDTRIIQFQQVTEPYAGTNMYRVLDTNKSLYDFKLSNSFLYGYYVMFLNSGLVLAPGGSSYTFSEFFDQTAQYGSYDSLAWRKLIAEKYHSRMYIPAQQVKMKGIPYTMVTHVQSIGYPGNPQGAIVVLIDNQEIRKLFKGLDVSEGGWAYIVNQQGQVISPLSSGEASLQVDLASLNGAKGVVEQTVDSRPMMITYTKSANNGWIYLIGQPTHVVLEKVRYIQKIILSLTGGFLVLGLLIAYMLAYRNSKPLKRIVNLIMEKSEGQALPKRRNTFELIGDTVSGLISNNHSLKAEIGRHIPLLRTAYFERLLNGQFVAPGDMDAIQQHVGLNLKGKSFVVAVMHLHGSENGGYSGELLEELYMQRVVSKDRIQTLLDQEGYVCEVAEDRIAIVFCLDPARAESYRELIGRKLQEAAADIADSVQALPVFGVGGLCDSLTGLSRSYEQAREALHIQMWRNAEHCVWFDELPDDRSMYYFPHDVELRLMNVAKAGDVAGVRELLADIERRNFEERHLTLAVLRLLLVEMWGSLVKLLPQMELNDERILQRMTTPGGEIDSLNGARKQYAAIVETYMWVCDNVKEHKKSQNVQLLSSVKTELEERYMEEDLCLDAVADRLRISKVYLSQFFKEQTGINFSDYLETLRMDRAKTLLETTDLSINEISGTVGYSSSNTFCRAFKRLHGISATAYKRSYGRHPTLHS